MQERRELESKLQAALSSENAARFTLQVLCSLSENSCSLFAYLNLFVV